MATVFQNTNVTTNAANTPAIILGNDSLVVGVSATVTALGATSDAIDASSVSGLSRFTINGNVYSAAGAGIDTGAAIQHIKIGTTGSIVSEQDSAISVRSGRSFITNSGLLNGDLGAIDIVGNVDEGSFITNTALMLGRTAGIRVQDGRSQITNHGTISSEGDGIQFEGTEGTHSITNFGMISGDFGIDIDNKSSVKIFNAGTIAGRTQPAIDGNNGIEDILNRGTIDGRINLGGGNDVLDSTLGFLTGTVFGGAGADKLTGGEGVDRLNGEGDSDTINGNGGADVINGGTGADVMDGGNGNDVITVDNVADQVLEGAGGGVDTVFATVSFALADDQEIEYLRAQGSGGIGLIGLTLTGNEFNNTIVGGTGFDSLDGEDGNDTLDGRAGVDTMEGGAGNDTYIVDNPLDKTIELFGMGNDTVRTGVSYGLATGTEVEQLRTLGSTTTTAINLSGNEFNNTLQGNAAANTLGGGSGADVLFGFGGNDSLTGGSGKDVLDGGAGVDLANFADHSSSVKVVLGGAAATTVVVGASSSEDTIRNFENVTGGSGNDSLAGDGLANTLAGGSGNDILTGNAGADTLDGGAGSDSAIYTEKTISVQVTLNKSANATVKVGLNNEDTIRNVEHISSGSGNDTLTGDTLFNVLNGGGGNDVLNGAGGPDSLAGGAGKDTFVFNSILSSVVTIRDFNVADDTITLHKSVFTGLQIGSLSGAAFRLDSAAGDSFDRIIYNSAVGKLLYDPDGVGGVGQTQFAILPTGLALTANDFVVI